MAQLTKIAKTAVWLLIAAIAGASLIGASAYLYLSPNLPLVDDLRDIRLQTPLRVYTNDGKLIGEFGEERRTPITYEQIPPMFKNAVLAIEDSRFYEHHGVSIKGLLRAFSQLLLTGKKAGGGSTITMQVAKNYFFTFEKKFSRKFSEILLSLQIEQELSKQEILELYVNKIFLGKRAYGFEAAAQVYYGKTLSELNLPQFAMLAGLPQSPSVANPIINPERAARRRNVVLGRMRQLDYIDEEAYQQALASPVSASYHGPQIELSAPYVAEMVRKDMLQRYGREAYSAGYSVYTTIDSRMQTRAETSIIEGLLAYDLRHGYRGPEQNVVAEDPLQNRDLWLSALANASTPGDLVPAFVSAVDEKAFVALTADGRQRLIEWDNGIKSMRPYLSESSRGPTPKTASDVVAIGDLVRLRQDESGSWHLTQLPAVQSALVSLDATNGAILSLVGGFNYNQSKFNRITQATRQPGSNFKPFIYTAALENGFTPASIFNDAAFVIEDESLETDWRPTNSNDKFNGPTRMREALYRSLNLVSIRLLYNLGLSKAISYVERFGFDPKALPRDLSLALGSHSVTPMQIVSGYSVLANGGYKVSPYLVDRIDDINGETLYLATPDTVCTSCENAENQQEIESLPEVVEVADEADAEMATLEDILNQAPKITRAPLPAAQRIVEPRAVFLIDNMMRDVVKRGTARKALSLKRNDLAGKTGTSNGPTDAWFSGWGGGVVTTVWTGFDDNTPLGRNEYGGKASLPIWINFMEVALAGRPEITPLQPEGVVRVKIDPTTGLLAKPGQKDAIFEYFRSEYAPTEEVDISNIAGDTTDLEEISEEDIF